jgi:hypothetical protein
MQYPTYEDSVFTADTLWQNAPMTLRPSVILLTLFLVLGISSRAESLSAPALSSGRPSLTRKQKLWRISAAVLGAVTIADIQSSYGRREMNPLLQSGSGRFEGRGIALKSAVAGGAVAAQWLMLRKHPEASGYAAAINFVASAATGAVVIHNHGQ